MKSPRNQLIVAFAACTVALASYSAWHVLIANKSSAVARLENEIEIKTRAEDRIASARAALAKVAADEALMESYFVSETGVVEFINDLEARGAALGATVKVLSVAEDTANAYRALTFVLSIEGTFDAALRTIGSIEYSPRHLRISALSLAQNQDSRGGWRADLRLVVGSALRQREGVASSTPETTL